MSKRALTYDTVAEKTTYRLAGVDYEITIEGGSGIPDAPEDGKPYVREDGEWTEATPAEIGAAAADTLSAHTGSTSNPHSVTASQAGALASTAFSGLAKITVGATAPSAPSTGDTWIDTSGG